MRFVVDNMHCDGCAKGVVAAVRQADPAARVDVNLERKEIEVSGGTVAGEGVRDALVAAGWKTTAAA